jgi:hypothetical protein
VDWINLAHDSIEDPVDGSCEQHNITSDSINGKESLHTMSDNLLSIPVPHGGKGKVIPAHTIEARWRLVVNITYRPLYPREKKIRYLLNRALDVPHGRYGRFGGKKNILILPGFESQIVRPSYYPKTSQLPFVAVYI